MAIADMQKRFHTVGAEKEAIQRKSAPVRYIRDAIRDRVNHLEQQMRPLSEAIKAIEAPVFELDMERARLARALSGKTGVPPPREAGKPLMTEAEIIELLRSYKIDSAVPVPTGVQDNRVDALAAAVRELSAKIDALPVSVDQSEAVKTVYADLKMFAQAVQMHETAIAAIKTDIGVIKDDLGVFVRILEAKG